MSLFQGALIRLYILYDCGSLLIGCMCGFVQRVWEESEVQTEEEQTTEQDEVTR